MIDTLWLAVTGIRDALQVESKEAGTIIFSKAVPGWVGV
jgi:hypothetical protein